MHKMINPDDIPVLRQSEQFFVGPIHSIISIPVTIKMCRILNKSGALQLADRIEFAQSFSVATKAFPTNIAIVHDNIAEQVEFIHNYLFLRPIFFDEMLEHLLRTKRNLHVMH